MTTDINSELFDLRREIAQHQRDIEDRQALIEVLSQDGHDVREHTMALNKDRAELATSIARQFQLINATTQI